MWSWGFNNGVLCPRLGSKRQTVHRALNPISTRRLCHADETYMYKAETAVHGCHYLLGDVAVCMPGRGLLFECVTCFYCSKGVRSCQMCANSNKKKQDDQPPWVAEICTTHPLPRVQKQMTHPLSAPTHPPPRQYFLTSPLLPK